MSFNQLRNKIIESICVNENNSEISFLINTSLSLINLEDKQLQHIWPKNVKAIPYLIMKYKTEADCCNEVWFEDIENAQCLINSSIYSIEEKKWNMISDTGDEVCLENAFWTIKTSKGYTDIEVRNSHNGYYGGNVLFDGIYTNVRDFEIFEKEKNSQITKLQKKIFIIYEKEKIKVSSKISNLKEKKVVLNKI